MSGSSRSYLIADEADDIAASLPATVLASYLAASVSQKNAALELASADLDTAMRYQGRKYDPEQALEFPRVAYETPVASRYGSAIATSVPDTIWDWDADADEAVVPAAVKMACLLQAESILSGNLERIYEAMASGLASQSVGGMSESYRTPAELEAMGLTAGLNPRAAKIMDQYALRQGKLL